MSKTVETFHYRIERFNLSQAEIIAALRLKYGNDPSFADGKMTAAHLETLFPQVPGYGELGIEFTVEL
ncbi:MAG: hypothetical protein ACOKSU_25995 [Pseudomonas sp.]|uniref:hypothetical protein n=1 Tax=Pseudomonas TaxID=286 RepID=UPI0003C09261|nr:hypothetical protein [Pseudomonas sp. VLB120]AGZ34718.1 hypothetical protein PVLB_09610 [Pseudomonas sp. VLB120]